MDTNDKASSQPIDEQATLEQSTSEATQEAPEQTVETSPDVKEEATQEEGAKEAPSEPSRRENLRIQQLLAKMNAQKRSAPSQPEQPKALNYREALEADDEVVKTLEQDRETYGQHQYTQGLSQAEKLAQSQMFHTRLELDAPKVAKDYPIFDNKSPEFNPVLTDSVNRMYLNFVGYDHNTGSVERTDVRYAEFVEAIFELGNEIGTKKAEASRKNIAKQAASTGLRPDGSKAKGLNLNKAPSDMTDEELEAVINGAIKK